LNRPLAAVLLLLVVSGTLPLVPVVQAGAPPQATVNNQYLVNRYGYAVINETVKLKNNYSVPLSIPDMQFGFGNLSTMVTSFSISGSGYAVSRSTGAQGSLFTVSGGGQTIAAGGNSSFSLKAYVNGITKIANKTIAVQLLTRPYLSFGFVSGKSLIKMPGSTQLKSIPPGYRQSVAGTNVTYSQVLNGSNSQQALTGSFAVLTSAGMDFHPLAVYSASRHIVVSSDGSPIVMDRILLGNLGTTQLSSLTVAPLTAGGGQIIVLPSSTPPLTRPTIVTMTNRAIDLTNADVGLPVEPGSNLTITYQYPLAKQYFKVSGGAVSLTVPLAPPVAAYVNSYTLGLSLPTGARSGDSGSRSMTNVEPFKAGTAAFSYSLSVGWAVDRGVPAASVLFVILLVGLFAAKTRTAPGAEAEEETATEVSADMVKAFEEKTSLINGMFDEISKTDPNQLNKSYFDELRGRLDVFRSRAIQRLNDVKQKSKTQKIFDLLGQIHETEREVDRAAKDMLNLYEQFYARRMRQEVFDRLLPNYKRRLEKALNRLSDELNTTQRESKLL
jgi:hypothetical protein